MFPRGMVYNVFMFTLFLRLGDDPFARKMQIVIRRLLSPPVNPFQMCCSYVTGQSVGCVSQPITERAKGSHEGAFLGVAAPETTEQPIRTMNTAVRVVPNGAHSGPSGTNSLMSANALFGPTYSLAAKLGLPLPNLAPEIESEPREPTLPPTLAMLHAHAHSRPGTLITSLPDGRQTGRLSASDILGTDADGQIGVIGLESGLVEPEFPKRKKYAKEAWPGKRPGFLVGPTA
ncbi:hypothetical protein AHF37_06892 [Paragonimus kellicotti]|nr:hypothetical protein AHF37_06892 [Paragonimus kellicotti]